MRKFTLLGLVLGMILTSFGQKTFENTFGGAGFNYGYSVVQTSDGGYVIIGITAETFEAESYDVYLIKTDANGDTIWTHTYGGTGYDYGTSVVQTSDGGYLISGGTESFGAGSSDVYLIKTDADGYTTWTKTYGGVEGDYGYSVVQTSDGGYVVSGSTESFGAGSHDVYLIKTNADGDTTWTKTYGGAGLEYGTSVVQTSDGGYVITGITITETGIYVYLIKTNANGNVIICDNTLSEINLIGCDYVTTPSGISVYQTGEIEDVITNSKGCDSIIKINVLINESKNVNDTILYFVSDTSFISLQELVFKTDSTKHLSTDSTGCDSLVYIYNMFTYKPDTMVTEVMDTMIITDTSVTEVFDTSIIQLYDVDTVIIEVFDTSEVLLSDTNIITLYSIDTLTVEVFDTLSTYDTIIVVEGDTQVVTLYNIDTLTTEVFDTVSVTETVTYTIFDTISVMDTTTTVLYQIDTQVVTINDTNEVMIDVYDTTYVSVHDTLVITMSSDTAAGIDFLTTQVNVYPNPASTQLNVEIDMSGDYTVSLTNINGQMVFTQANVVDDLQIDISDFTKGLYFITIRDNDGVLKAEERKIVIE